VGDRKNRCPTRRGCRVLRPERPSAGSEMRQGLRCELPRMSRNGGVPWRDAGLHVPAKVCFSRRPVVSLALGNTPLILLVLSGWVDEADLLVPRSKSFRRSSLASTRNLTQAETAVLESLARPSSQWWGTSDTGEDLPRWCAHLSTRTFDKYETKSYSAPTRGWRIARHRISCPRTAHGRRLTQ
jgi:hypothetical protein